MFRRAVDAGLGQELVIQETMIFEHDRLRQWVRMPG